MSPGEIEAAAAVRWPGVPMARRGRVLRIGAGAKRGGGSIVVELEGVKRGAWYDHATQEGGWLTDDGRSTSARPSDLPTIRHRPRLELDDRSLRLDRVLAAAQPIIGTPGERYLGRRGIDLQAIAHERARLRGIGVEAVLDDLPIRWSPHPPAVLFIARDGDGRAVACQLVAVTADGRKDRSRAVVKRTLVAGAGWLEVGALRLPVLRPFTPLLVAEGPETALSLWLATGHPTWSALGPHLGRLPYGTRKRVVLCRDADERGSDGDGALWRAALQVLERGYACAIADVRLVGFGPGIDGGGKDFNDLLQARGPGAVAAAVEAAVTIDEARCRRRIALWQTCRAERDRALAA